jgi:phosphoserine phosphatase RsbU/P
MESSLENDFSDNVIDMQSENIGGARIIHQDLTETIEAATGVLPLEPPESGDFHEALQVPDGSGDVVILLGDVTGHGAPAAEKADKIRRAAISSVKSGCSPLEIVENANTASEEDDDDRFSTLFVAKIDGTNGEVSYANAGHEPPIIARSDGHSDSLLTTGPPLGVVPSKSNAFAQEHAQLSPGGTLLVTTDGVLEAREHGIQKPNFFGYERLVSLLRNLCHLPPARIVSSIIASVLSFSRSVLHDDLVVMAIRRKAEVVGAANPDISTS